MRVSRATHLLTLGLPLPRPLFSFVFVISHLFVCSVAGVGPMQYLSHLRPSAVQRGQMRRDPGCTCLRAFLRVDWAQVLGVLFALYGICAVVTHHDAAGIYFWSSGLTFGRAVEALAWDTPYIGQHRSGAALSHTREDRAIGLRRFR